MIILQDTQTHAPADTNGHENGVYVASPFKILWTRDDCERFERDGLLEEGKYELINGEILREMKNQPHLEALTWFMAWLIPVFGKTYIQAEGTVDVMPQDNPTNAPEPDLVVLAQPHKAFYKRRPKPGDVLLAVELAESTLRYDLITRAGLYARAEFPEYWVADLTRRELHVHRNPQNGVYLEVFTLTAEQTVASLARPDAAVLVGDLIP